LAPLLLFFSLCSHGLALLLTMGPTLSIVADTLLQVNG